MSKIRAPQGQFLVRTFFWLQTVPSHMESKGVLNVSSKDAILQEQAPLTTSFNLTTSSRPPTSKTACWGLGLPQRNVGDRNIQSTASKDGLPLLSESLGHTRALGF